MVVGSSTRYHWSIVLDGLEIAAAKKRIVAWLEEQGTGRFKVQYKLRDWLFSRQRYWGERFPIVHPEDGTVVLRDRLEVPAGSSREELERLALESEGARRFTDGRTRAR